MKTSAQLLLIGLFLSLFNACTKDQEVENPTIDQEFTWETTAPSELGWDASAIDDLKQYLSDTDARSFMILVDGKIVMEEYFHGHTDTDTWQWNSAGKTLVTTSIGIAQQNGLLDIDDKVSDYLGIGWTRAPSDKEELITIKDLLMMTSGLDDEPQLVIRANLTYLADAGSRWAYSNVFQKLMDVIAEASGDTFEKFFNDEVAAQLGMEGFWNFGLIYSIYHSDTRSMAKYGQMALNGGIWEGETIINAPFFNASISPAQTINPSYGYMWWLNGQSRFMVPSSQTVFDSQLIPNAPADLYAGMGKDEQRVYIIPSKNMVIVRMGEVANAGEEQFALSSFDNTLWEKLNAVIE